MACKCSSFCRFRGIFGVIWRKFWIFENVPYRSVSFRMKKGYVSVDFWQFLTVLKNEKKLDFARLHCSKRANSNVNVLSLKMSILGVF